MPRNIDDLIYRHPGAVLGVFVPVSQEEGDPLDSEVEDEDEDVEEEDSE